MGRDAAGRLTELVQKTLEPFDWVESLSSVVSAEKTNQRHCATQGARERRQTLEDHVLAQFHPRRLSSRHARHHDDRRLRARAAAGALAGGGALLASCVAAEDGGGRDGARGGRLRLLCRCLGADPADRRFRRQLGAPAERTSQPPCRTTHSPPSLRAPQLFVEGGGEADYPKIGLPGPLAGLMGGNKADPMEEAERLRLKLAAAVEAQDMVAAFATEKELKQHMMENGMPRPSSSNPRPHPRALAPSPRPHHSPSPSPSPSHFTRTLPLPLAPSLTSHLSPLTRHQLRVRGP